MRRREALKSISAFPFLSLIPLGKKEPEIPHVDHVEWEDLAENIPNGKRRWGKNDAIRLQAELDRCWDDMANKAIESLFDTTSPQTPPNALSAILAVKRP